MMKDNEMLFQDPSLTSNAAHLKQRGHAEPTCRVGDLLRRHDPPQCQRALSATGTGSEAVRSCSDFGRSGSVPVRFRFAYGLIHRYSSETTGCVSRTSWASWASWASSVPGPIDPRGEWRSLAQNGMQKWNTMEHRWTQVQNGSKWYEWGSLHLVTVLTSDAQLSEWHGQGRLFSIQGVWEILRAATKSCCIPGDQQR